MEGIINTENIPFILSKMINKDIPDKACSLVFPRVWKMPAS